jgi:hypothetical protein
MTHGNCLAYALLMLFAENFTGSIEPRFVRGWPPKVRFIYRDAAGNRTRFAPRAPKTGWRACLDAFWYEGFVRTVSLTPTRSSSRMAA